MNRVRLYRCWSRRVALRLLADDRETSRCTHACYNLGWHYDDTTVRRMRLTMRLRRRILQRIENGGR
jgi:hypothetical protein